MFGTMFVQDLCFIVLSVKFLYNILLCEAASNANAVLGIVILSIRLCLSVRHMRAF